MFAFKFEVRTKRVLVKTKPFNRQTVISIIVQSAVQWHEHNVMPPALATTESLINGLVVDDALLELSPKQLL